MFEFSWLFADMKSQLVYWLRTLNFSIYTLPPNWVIQKCLLQVSARFGANTASFHFMERCVCSFRGLAVKLQHETEEKQLTLSRREGIDKMAAAPVSKDDFQSAVDESMKTLGVFGKLVLCFYLRRSCELE